MLLAWCKRAALRSFSRAIIQTQLYALAEAGADPVPAQQAVELVRRLRQQA